MVEEEIAVGVAAGYPEFLYRLEVGADSMDVWPSKVEDLVLRHPRSKFVSLGLLFQMGEVSFYGITLRTTLVPLQDIKKSGKLYKCWMKLIGKPLLQFLEKEGVNTNDE